VIVVSELTDLLDGSGGTAEALEDGTDIGTRLHGDDTELILLIDPDEESLISVVEDTTALGPVTVEATGLKEAVTLLEEEVIGDELVLDGSIHTFKRVEGTSKVALEGSAGSSDLLHDLVTLLVGDAGTERETFKVTANTDASGVDEGGLFFREWRAVKLAGIHVGDVFVFAGIVTVIFLDDLVEHLCEGGIRVVRASVDTDAGVDVLAAREDASLEGDTGLVTLVVVSLPDILFKVLAHERLGALGELGPADEVIN